MTASKNVSDEKLAREAMMRQASRDRAALESGSWWHSIELGRGIVTPGVRKLEDLRQSYASLSLPEDLTGIRVLDVGCWDGFYSFEAERHGAQVVAIDCFRPDNFFKAHAALHSRAEFHEMSVYDLNRKKPGAFDIVLFIGVLYHLRHPLLGLERICEVTSNCAIVESHVIGDFSSTPRPIMQFYELDELGGQYDNWWGPTSECLVQMIRAAGFARVASSSKSFTRATFKAWRNWEPNPSLEASPSIFLGPVTSAITWSSKVPRSGRNAFLGMYAKGLPAGVGREFLRVHVGQFGISPHFVGNEYQHPGYVQINVPVPPGLDEGPTPVWIEIGNQRSNVREVLLVEAQDW